MQTAPLLCFWLCRAVAICAAFQGGACTSAYGAGRVLGTRRHPVRHSLPGRHREAVDHNCRRCGVPLLLASEGPCVNDNC